MKKLMKNATIVGALTALCMIALGVFLIIFPDTALLMICRAVGVILLVVGLILLIMFLADRGDSRGSVEADNESRTNGKVFVCILGVILLAVGIWITLKPATVVGLVSLLLAIIMFIRGFAGISDLRQMRRIGDPRWWLSMIFIVVTLIFGMIILIQPFNSAVVMMSITGAFLILSGVCGLILQIRLLILAKRAYKAGAVVGRNVIDGHAEILDDNIDK